MFGGFPFGLMFLNFVGMILFFILIVMAVKFVVRGARGRGNHGNGGFCGAQTRKHGHHGKPSAHGWGHQGEGRHDRRDEALDLARERLARGEINAGEYQQLRTDLAAGNATGGGGKPHGGHHGHHGGRGRRDRALGVARLRFASGEISVDDFQSIRAALES